MRFFLRVSRLVRVRELERRASRERDLKAKESLKGEFLLREKGDSLARQEL